MKFPVIDLELEFRKIVERVFNFFGANILSGKSRCWKSKKFPYCDGAHNAHNKATGDNVGPLIIKRKA